MLGECEEEVRVMDRVALEFVDEERLEEDGSSNAGNGEKEDLGIVSCGGCAGRRVNSLGNELNDRLEGRKTFEEA